jgi:cyclopropane-fatty-acyl-phospholipid synthase
MPPTLAGSGVTAFDEAPGHSERSTSQTSRSRVTGVDRWICAQVQRSIGPSDVRLELWDGTGAANAPAEPIGALLVRDRRTLIGLATNPDLWFGEGYMSRRLDVRGSIRDVFAALSRASLKDPTWRERVAVVLAAANTLSGSRRNVQHHYDLGNEFYQLWLDRDLVYTCAYFPDRAMSLEAAQEAKLELVCQKLRLRPGETVCEAGCGWGALALHMARRYGVRVTAFNVSKEQLAYGRARAAREGLSHLVEFVDDDYRNAAGRFDAFVSVGMLEHVGLRHFSSLADVLRRTVKRDGGRGLLHFIGRDVPRPLNTWMRRRIFPGAYPPTLAEVTTRVLAPAGMSVIDVENLRLHYAQTLAHWVERFDAAQEQVAAAFGGEFTRAWRLYLSGSEAAFTTGWMQLFQVVFTPRESNPPSWTRLDPHEVPGAGA